MSDRNEPPVVEACDRGNGQGADIIASYVTPDGPRYDVARCPFDPAAIQAASQRLLSHGKAGR